MQRYGFFLVCGNILHANYSNSMIFLPFTIQEMPKGKNSTMQLCSLR